MAAIALAVQQRHCRLMAISDISELSGPQKAAIMMLAMGDDRAARMFGMMDDDEIRAISEHMVNLGAVDSEVIEALMREFVAMMSQTGAVAGTFESTERLLAKELGEDRVKEIMEELRGPAGRTMWDKLGNVNEEVLATYFKNEYPQTVAIVLSKVKGDHAARVLGSLPEDFAMEVITRMLSMEPVKKEVLDSIEKTLRSEFMSNLSSTSRIDSHEVMAEIFNSFDRSTEQRFMAALEERSRDSAERIKALMFTFEDLIKLDPSSVQTLLRNVEKATPGWRSRAPPRPCAISSSATCPSAPARFCARTWRRWGRCACLRSTRRSSRWAILPRTSPPRARSSSLTAAARTS